MEEYMKKERPEDKIAVCPNCKNKFIFSSRIKLTTKKLELENIDHLAEYDNEEGVFDYAEATLAKRIYDEGLSEPYKRFFSEKKAKDIEKTLNNGLPVDDIKLSPVFGCPYCCYPLQMYYEFKVVTIVVAAGTIEKLTDNQDGVDNVRTQRSVRVLQKCKQAGMMPPLIEALEHQRPNEPLPKDIDHFFLAYINSLRECMVNQTVLKHYQEQFPGNIRFYKGSGIVMVVSDGMIKAFFPQRFLSFVPKGAKTLNHINLTAGVSNFWQWKKTRYGYVPNDCKIFADELVAQPRGKYPSEKKNYPKGK